jgi:hypothetical protein
MVLHRPIECTRLTGSYPASTTGLVPGSRLMGSNLHAWNRSYDYEYYRTEFPPYFVPACASLSVLTVTLCFQNAETARYTTSDSKHVCFAILGFNSVPIYGSSHRSSTATLIGVLHTHLCCANTYSKPRRLETAATASRSHGAVQRARPSRLRIARLAGLFVTIPRVPGD